MLKISAGILLRSDMALADATEKYEAHADHNPTFVHGGFTAQKSLANYIGSGLAASRHVRRSWRCSRDG